MTTKKNYPFTIPKSWQQPLADFLQQPLVAKLAAFVEAERRLQPPIFPPKDLVFNSLQKTPYDAVRVVIVGQDPYHGPEQAHGLSFSVPRGTPIPPSLRNIYKELHKDLDIPPAKHGCLLSWAEQGVLLLNATLTVRRGQPKSHCGQGWEQFSDAILTAVVKKKEPIVFLLWGRSAKSKVDAVLQQYDASHHLILTAAHPSPLSAYNGFFGCRHFSQTNKFFHLIDRKQINWSLES